MQHLQDRKKDQKTILLAEDNESVATATKMYLRSMDFNVLHANNGEKVIEIAKSHHPDLILMDIQMPGTNGLQAIEAVRATPSISATPIIAVTGRAKLEDKTQCLQAGANQYLSKPYDTAELVKQINELCDD